TFACFLISAWLIYLTTRRFADPVSATIAVAIFCLSPDILAASIFFSTEGPLYLAVAGSLYFLSTYWSDEQELPGTWIRLGLSLGIGLLSKSTSALILGPLFLFSIIRAWRNRRGFRGVVSIVMASLLGALIAGPWWLKNIRPALAYLMYSSESYLPR